MKGPSDPRKAKRPAGMSQPPQGLKHQIGAGTASNVTPPTWPGGPPSPTITRGKTNLAAFKKGSR